VTKHKKRAAVVAVVAAIAMAGCASTQKYTLNPGPNTPAATGTAKVETSKQGNEKVELTVDHLPEPASLGGASNYVVWIEPAGEQQVMPAGALKIDENRQGKLDFVTPYKDFNVIVTAERTTAPSEPSDEVVLRGQIAAYRAG
jgi:hypothetical protein